MARTPEVEPDEASPRPQPRGTRLGAGWSARLNPVKWVAGLRGRVPRLLFLDDDPKRAQRFLKDHPQATWVTNVPDCVDRLAEHWDEVHLDHDLGGETFVDSSGADCGMEVIRWLCKEPRHHLEDVSFFVHTHNEAAGLLMVLLMRGNGYRAEFRPFGRDLREILAHNETNSLPEEDEDSEWSPSIGRRDNRLTIGRDISGRLVALVWRSFRPAFNRFRRTKSTVVGPKEPVAAVAIPEPRRDRGQIPVASTPAATGPSCPIEDQGLISETAAVIQPPPRTNSS